MTREENLDWLYRLKSEIFVFMPKEWLIPMADALDVAIRALEHPEKNVVAVMPCGDAISRDEVLKLMKDNWHSHNGDWAMQESMDDIRALPSVTPQEPILDKIRAEIENDWQLKKYPSSPFSCGLRRAIEIIDKYKAESEDNENG